ncbi:helix-turn-helix transcriptional regulator [Dactylosporangium roseum]|uniref:Helix-turn-helix transcriptional regulator n=1 Tax=Dactylosporangium roseum TaxID=47989 RepID=A0ABY5ZG43_9ACTN|nr:PadR family transcriptional regulator [Dactylosporangium roseum]UWZ39928.1 helix-turn-helix transcriptional regulator [Dactylosporangium roseum]
MFAPLVLLGLLAAGPRHGYDLKRAYDRTLPRAKPLGFGQVYATLGRLERDGLVVRSGHERDGGPDRTVYALTDDGHVRLTEWLGTVEEPAPHVASTLLAKVVVALLAAGPEQALAYLAAQRKAHAARLRGLTRTKAEPGATIGDVIAADYAIAHLDADLTWLAATIERVARQQPEEPS